MLRFYVNKLQVQHAMLSKAFNRLTGFADVEQRGKVIIISGVSASTLSRDMKYIWNTSKIAGSMFIKATWSEIRIPSFFALEFQYILRKLVNSRGLYTSKRVLNNVIDALETQTWIANISVPQQPWLDRSKLKEIIYPKLLPHQAEFLDIYESTRKRYGLNGMLLAAAPGAGKSISGCSIALTTNATKVIIISPMNAIHKVWQKTLNTEFHIPQHPYVYKDSPNQFQPQKKWHIFHYEALDKAVELAKLFRNEKVCIIIDECHNFNEIKSMRTQRLLDLGSISGSNDILWMSGTPVKALGFETIPLLKSIDPLFDEPTENAFRKMFGKDAKRTLDILAHRLGLISHTVPKSEFMEEKPIYETVKVKMPNADKYTLPELSKVMSAFIEQRMEYYKANKAEYQAIYDKCIDIHRATLHTPTQVAAFKEYQNAIQHLVRNGFDNKRDAEYAVLTNKYEKNVIHPSLPQELRKPFANAKSVIKYVELKVRGECLGRILTKERIQCHVDMLSYIDFKSMINGVEKKTLIFTNYVAVVDKCTAILKEQGFKPLAVHAETNNELNSIVGRFDKDPTINPLVATYDSLSTAVPLTMANGVIFLNNPWRSYIKDQAIARAWRVGQDKQVYGFDIILDTGSVPNISSRSLDIMQWSKDQVDRIMGISGGTDVSIEQYSGFAVPQIVDANEWVEDVLYDPENQVHNVVGSVIPTAQEKAYRPSQYQFYARAGRVAMEALDESTTIPLNSLEAGSSSDKCQLPPDWKPVDPTTPTK